MTRRIAGRSFTLLAAALLAWPALAVLEREALPMLRRWKVDVVAYGPSLHDADSWYLMRSFSSLEDRQRSEDSFYGSDEWKKGPREAILADIESYTTIVLPFDDPTIRGLRRTPP